LWAWIEGHFGCFEQGGLPTDDGDWLGGSRGWLGWASSNSQWGKRGKWAALFSLFFIVND